jgi:hypothetical protein
MIRRGQGFRRIFLCPSQCPAHAGHPVRRGHAVSAAVTLDHHPLSRMLTVAGTLWVQRITNQFAKILAFTLAYIHDAS